MNTTKFVFAVICVAAAVGAMFGGISLGMIGPAGIAWTNGVGRTSALLIFIGFCVSIAFIAAFPSKLSRSPEMVCYVVAFASILITYAILAVTNSEIWSVGLAATAAYITVYYETRILNC